MNDSSLEQIESLLAQKPRTRTSVPLREQILRVVQRELRAARWDRRLARLAACLLAVGVGLNLAALQPGRATPRATAVAQQTPARIAELAIEIAELTDAETGRRFALQMAALNGWSSSGQQFIELEREIQKQL